MSFGHFSTQSQVVGHTAFISGHSLCSSMFRSKCSLRKLGRCHKLVKYYEIRKTQFDYRVLYS